MNADFIWRSGKFKGKTYAWVSTYQPWYINWVLENRPEMLVERNKPKPKQCSGEDDEDEESISEHQWKKSKLIQPNLDFFKENGNNI